MSAVPNAQPRIEPMRMRDIDAVVGIERNAYSFPWTRLNFSDSLASGYSAWACRSGGELVAYAVMMLVLDEAHLLNVTVAPDWQRRGCGMLMMHHLFSTARAHGAKRMFLEVRPSNESGIALYRRCGFERIGLRRAYYPASPGREDAVVMAMNL